MHPITFRVFKDNDRPAAGELWVRPARDEDRRRRATALLVYENGLAALERGDGEVRQLVVDAEGTQPTFDEMLAALFARYLLEGRPLPPVFGDLAEYARQLRQGRTPTRLPPEQTIEGLYLAVRNLAGARVDDPDLTRPENAARFLEGWQRLAACLERAAERSLDPFTESPFPRGAEFATERAFLLRDRDRYLRDVSRGERWAVRLPGTDRPGSGLFLRRPRSLLFPYWSRQDRDTPTKEPYVFLAVCWGPGSWVFTTDPVHEELQLTGLAERLRTAEKADAAEGLAAGRREGNGLLARARRLLPHGPAAPAPGGPPGAADAAASPWYGGEGHGGTLVSSTRGPGTRLPEDRVLRVVREWARAKQAVPPWKPHPGLVPALAAACLLAVLGFIAWSALPSPSQDRAVYRKVAPAVVLVETKQDRGTGFLISDDGWLVTNFHVVRAGTPDPETGALRATVYLGKLTDDRMTRIDESVPALLYRSNAVKDLALLKLTKRPAGLAALPHLSLASGRAGRRIEVGEPCWVVGNPAAGTAWLLRRGQVDQVAEWPRDTPDVVMAQPTAGLVSRAALNDVIEKLRRKVILSQCDLGPGDSGSPLVDSDGEVIGVSFAIPSARGGGAPRFAYHVHLDELTAFLEGRDRLAPTPPAYDPNPEPRDSAHKLADYVGTSGELDSVIFYRPEQDGSVTVTGLWLDLLHRNRGVTPDDVKDERRDPVANGRWQYQFGVLFEPFPIAFYDTDGDGQADLIVEDSDGDGKADVVLRRGGGGWAVSPKDAGRPLVDPGWFGKGAERAAKRLPEYSDRLSEKQVADVLRGLGPVADLSPQ